MRRGFKIIYGPVASWRLGISLGIDLLSQKEKICNFDCIYCQLGRQKDFKFKRQAYVSVRELIKELKTFPKVRIDSITFSGRGEPALARNLGEAIKSVKKIRKEPVAVLTNSTLMAKEGVRKELAFADIVVAKLDAYSQKSLEQINHPSNSISFKNIISGLIKFRRRYKGKFALQIMFTQTNRLKGKEIADLAVMINPDEIQINTPLRPSKAKALAKKEILKIKEYFLTRFKKTHIISAYDAVRIKKAVALNNEETCRRRSLFLE